MLCATCGTQFPPQRPTPAVCPICADPRQYLPPGGQRWITLDALRRGHANAFRQVAAGYLAIETQPAFAIGQRALLVRTAAGNLLWDCVALIDDATVALLQGLGGLAAVAISHPHYYTTMVDWGHAFGCRVLLHGADRAHVARPDACLEFWEGDSFEALPGLMLHRLGGHFAGGTVLHDARRRALLTGDIVQVAPDRAHVSFLWSYPNMVPLPGAFVSAIGARLEVLDFDAVHGAFAGRDILTGGKEAVRRSVARYVQALSAIPA